MNRLRNIFLCISVLAALAGCRVVSVEVPYENQSNVVTVPSYTGSTSLMVVTDYSWTAWTDADWLVLGKTSGEGSMSVKVTYKANDGFPRVGKVMISPEKTDTCQTDRVDTVLVRQYGKAVRIDFEKNLYDLRSRGGSYNLDFTTNLDENGLGEVEANVDEASSKWLQASISGKSVVLEAGINDTMKPRKGTCIISYNDGWGRSTMPIEVSQPCISGDGSTQDISFAQLKNKISHSTGDYIIGTNISISGQVAGDCNSPNEAMNPQISQISIDYSISSRTAYIQSEDASDGVLVLFDAVEDNCLKRGQKVRIHLQGAKLIKYDNPERYQITGLTESCVMSISEPQALPVKTRTISGLTDRDIYTSVTLTDCEMGVKKGSYTPINEGYGRLYNAFRIDCYPNLVVDREGSSIFMMVNLGCPWRRTGSGVLQGSGSITGVIVNEPYKRFERDGNIGRYQIRPMYETDMALDASSTISSTIAEWNLYSSAGSANKGYGTLSHSAGTMSKCVDFSYLGPMTGVYDQDKKGANSGSYGTAKWWYDGKGEYFMATFSTTGITDGILTAVFTQQNAIGGPRYWAAEYSIDGTSWKTIKEYNVPDVVNWDNTQYEQIDGFKPIMAVFPSECLGRAKVFLRLRARSNVAGTSTGYDNGTVTNTVNSYLSYLAIRRYR